jgi:hypothetical protein
MISGSFVRTPTLTPYVKKEIPAAHPRRSIFSIQVDFHLDRGIADIDAHTLLRFTTPARRGKPTTIEHTPPATARAGVLPLIPV